MSKHNSIPYMCQAIFSYVLVNGRIVDPYEDGFIGGSGRIVSLPTYNVKISH